MTDGFFSRPSWVKLLLWPAAPNRDRIEGALAAAGVRAVSAIFVSHSHHDHAMDAPYVANLTGATIVGSQSTQNIARGAQFPAERTAVIDHESICRFGEFVVTSFRTPHSRPNLIPGEIEAPLKKTARVWDFEEGGNFTFHVQHPLGNVLIVPSVGVREDWLVPQRADTVFLGVGGLKRSERQLRPYWKQFVEGSGGRRIYPIHWDNFAKAGGRDVSVPKSLHPKLESLKKLASSGQIIRVPGYAELISLSREARAGEFPAPVIAEQGCRAANSAKVDIQN